MTYTETTRSLMAVALGNAPADLVITGGRLFNVFTGELLDGRCVLVKHGKIAGLVRDAKNSMGADTEIIDASGKTLIPGLIDGHTHLSWMFTPEKFLAHAMAGGTTSIVTEIYDPCYVCGQAGALDFLAALADQPVKIFAVAPAMVSISRRTRGIDLDELKRLLARPDLLGIGESYWQGVLQSPDIFLPEFEAARAQRKTIEGHSAGASEKKLNAYAAAGVSSCHEPIRAEEALDRLRLGMHVMVREGSVRRELSEMAKLKDAGADLRRLCLVSDGMSPDGLLKDGYMESVVQKAIDYGFRPEDAIRMATLNIAEHFSLDNHIGAIAPGRDADILILPDIRTIAPEVVISKGKIIARNGNPLVRPRSHVFSKAAKNSVRLPRPLVASDFSVPTEASGKSVNIRLIEMVTDLVTRETILDLPVCRGTINGNPEKDIIKITAVDRSVCPGDLFTGFIQGFGLTSGAFSLSAAWDVADIIVIGTCDGDMAAAVNRIHTLQGGVVVADNGKIIEELALPIFGILSDAPVAEIAASTAAIRQALLDRGVSFPDPLLTLATLTTAAIPFFKICEEGYVGFKDGITRGLFADQPAPSARDAT